MSVMSWNCRGLGMSSTVRELRTLVQKHAPTVLCVVETQLHRTRVEKLAPLLGFKNSFAVSSTGRSGGLGMYWNDDVKIEILPYSQYHMDTIVTGLEGDPWRLTCVYGEARTTERHKTWDMLKFIISSTDLPWICLGDFNEVLHRHEHVGVQERSMAQMAGFRDMMDVCGLADLGYRGNSWTFEKKGRGRKFLPRPP